MMKTMKIMKMMMILMMMMMMMMMMMKSMKSMKMMKIMEIKSNTNTTEIFFEEFLQANLLNFLTEGLKRQIFLTKLQRKSSTMNQKQIED